MRRKKLDEKRVITKLCRACVWIPFCGMCRVVLVSLQVGTKGNSARE